MKKITKAAIFVLLLLPVIGFSQINSPYSRYGVGNLVTQGNISNRGMGGIAAGVSDPASVNTVNPASYGNLIYTTLDFALEYNGMNLKSKVPVSAFKSNNALFSYINIGVPLLSGNKKAAKNNTNWGLAFGLKPETHINYKIISSQRNAIDSVSNIFEGSGGVNKAFVGSALRLKKFSFGFNTGYLFGEKNYTTQLIFNNDTVNYYKANYATKSNFGGMFLDAGVQYQVKLKKGYLRLGAYTNLKSSYSARRDDTRETFVYGQYDDLNRLDSVYQKTDQKGKVVLPATYGFGFVFENTNLLVGADFKTSRWSDYRYFGQNDLTQNSWMANVGLQYLPATSSSTNYFSFVKYRAGFAVGKDYIKVEDDLPVYSFSLGGAFPLRLKRGFFDRQFSVMNVTFEYGSRGNKNNNITESTYKISLGFSLSDVWFLRQKYQ